MSVAKCYSALLTGLTAEIVTVEVDISNGLNALVIVGLGDRSVDEAKDRVSAAIKNSGYVSPKQKNQKVVISLAPADLRKEGPSFDLAMAVSYLAAAGDIGMDPARTLFFGELSLEGRVRKVTGLLPILCQAAALGFDSAFVPADNIKEASMAPNIRARGVATLNQLIDHLSGRSWAEPPAPDADNASARPERKRFLDMSVIRGNETAKRGLEIAAAGGHNILLYGPPGTGKTMLAQSFPSILPPLPIEQVIEVTGIHSAAGILGSELVTEPPFRSPHHTASYPAIVGGGAFPRPGEITLAHRGVLFLDEFPEFDKSVLEALRQPLEEHSITISRAKGTVTFPAQCILIASMNPCQCGKPRDGGCICKAHELRAYRRRLSGPIMDRLDITLNVNKVDYDKLSDLENTSEKSVAIRERVEAARAVQADRFVGYGSHKRYNGELSAEDIDKMMIIDHQARLYLKATAKNINLSGRAFHRVIKVARTIADLAGEPVIKKLHIMEALQYRQKVFEDG